MLILNRRNPERRPGVTLYVGDEVTVTVLSVQGNQVRIGIEAPKDVTVDREEIRRRKQASKTHPA